MNETHRSCARVSGMLLQKLNHVALRVGYSVVCLSPGRAYFCASSSRRRTCDCLARKVVSRLANCKVRHADNEQQRRIGLIGDRSAACKSSGREPVVTGLEHYLLRQMRKRSHR